MAEANINYRTRPYVCGAIGNWDPTAIGRLRRASPGPTQEIYSGPLAVLWSTSLPAVWGTQSGHGFSWGALADGRTPTSWIDAAGLRLAAGLQLSGRKAILHTDGLGMQDLYVRRSGEALYFSVRIEPLLDIVDGLLHIDWCAWASVAAVTSPLADATPFQEVRRLAAATAWEAAGGRLKRMSFEPPWIGAEPDPCVTAADAVAMVSEQMGGDTRHTSITLSGGWDSRLLAILARRRVRRMVAWTTSNDDGRDRDIEFARIVAKALRMRHRVHVPGPHAWIEEHSAVRRRVNYQTSHHVWIMPLVRILHDRRDQYLDGLAGDVLFKSLFVDQAVADADTPAEQRRLLWDALEQKRLRHRNLLARGVAHAFERLGREAFEMATSRFDGHPAAATLSVLHTRTARAIASSAQWLLGPEVSVRLPFLHPDVIATALRVPLSAKLGGEFYRAMLFSADATTATLPSTNDGRPTGKRGIRRHASRSALDVMAEAILADEHAARLLAPDLRLALRDPAGLSMIGRSSVALRTLHWVSLFGEWRSTYAGRLADEEFDAG